MIFDIQYKEPKVYDGYAIAGEVLISIDLVERIEDVVKFTYTTMPSLQVAYTIKKWQDEFLHGERPKVIVTDYWYKGAHVVGKTDETRKIYVNRNGIQSRSVITYLRNGAHEAGHYPFGFSHGSNYTQDTRWGRMMCRIKGDKEDKELSVPYMLEKLVLGLARERGMIK